MAGCGMTNDDEFDFSSYLVDLGDDPAVGSEAGPGTGPGKSAQPAPAASLDSPKPLQTHSAKNWSGPFLASAGASVSPSPPETASDSSYPLAGGSVKALSQSDVSTAPSSIASTSYTGSAGSWMTEKASARRPGGPAANSNGTSAPLSGLHRLSSTGPAASSPSSTLPLNLSFAYDFAHDPVNSVDTESARSQGSRSQLSSSMPSHNGFNARGDGRQLSAMTKSDFDSSTLFNENAIEPSSGPISRNSRSRQSSAMTASSAASPISFASQGWLSMTPASPSASQLSSSHPSKPYSRPQHTDVNGSSSTHTLHKKASTKRKLAVSTSAGPSSPAVGSAVSGTMSSIGSYPLPTPGYLHGGLGSAIQSPINPGTDAFPERAQTTSVVSSRDVSAAPSPSHDTQYNYSGTAVDAFQRATDEFLASFHASQVSTPAAPTPQTSASDIDKAVNLAGVGGKWFNWASQQPEEKGVQTPHASEVLSTLMNDELELFPPPSAAPTPASTYPVSPSVPRSQRETSLAPQGFGEWGNLDGKTPEELAATDPLATHLWRVLNKAKSGLPSGARMENITWRMMSLKINKQKEQREKEKERLSSAQTSTSQPKAQTSAATSTSATEKPTAKLEDEERGRKSRSAANSVSPGESGDAVDMDWRQASRSRSRAPLASMDWRAASRSRSRAPNMRITMPRGPSGFSLPSYTASDAAWQEEIDAAVAPPASSSVYAVGSMSSPRQTAGGTSLPSVEDTLKYFMASNAPPVSSSVSPPSARNNPTPTSAAPAPKPSTFPQPAAEQAPASAFSSLEPQQPMPIPQNPNMFDPSFMIPSLGASESSSSLSESKQSLNASIDAYISSLSYSASLIDLPPHKHSGSVPGLFHEQELKHNQHADYGFLPKLVRKTSFDESYPASLAQAQQRKTQPSEVSSRHMGYPAVGANTTQAPQNSHSVASTPQPYPYNGGFRMPSQSQPGTPRIPHATAPVHSDLAGHGPFSPQFAMASQNSNTAVEAFRRLQAAQALQVANMNLAASNGGFQPYVDPSLMHTAPYMHPQMPNPMPSADEFQAMDPSHLLLGSSFNAYPPVDSLDSPWTSAVAAQATPSPSTGAPTPEEVANLEKMISASSAPVGPSRTPSVAGLGGTQEKSAPKRGGHSKNSSMSTPGDPAGEGSAPTVCVNCKTTNTPLWRRDEYGHPLCNACQLFRKLHGSDRPVSLHNSVIKKRNRQRNNKDPPKKGARAQSRRNSTSASGPKDTENSTT